MIRAIIVDDERPARDNLKTLLERNFNNIKIVGEANSCKMGIEVLNNIPTDLLFLDIDLTDGSGFNILEALDKISFQVIFVTAYDEYAIKAFKYSALDYILKPINLGELHHAIEKMEELISKDQPSQLDLQAILNNLQTKEEDRRIAITDKQEIRFVNVSDIVRCQSDNNYTKIYLLNGERYVVSKTLKEYENLLPQSKFFRVHQSHLVNMDHVSKFLREEGGYVVMRNGDQLEISRRKKEDFFKKMSIM